MWPERLKLEVQVAMEDAVTFLETAKKLYSDVTLLLNKSQLLALDMDPKQPFTDQVWTLFILSEVTVATSYKSGTK